MKKFLILIIVLPFLAASCDLGGVLDFGSGTRGVFKSEDGGQTFSPSDKLVSKGDFSNLSVNDLAIVSAQPDVLYAGVSSGMYKSENAAGSWNYILTGIAVASIAVDPSTPGIIYAAGVVGKNGKIIKSMDGGSSWTDVYTEPSNSNTVLSIALPRSNSSIILAGLSNGELIRSTDAGKTWQATKDFADRVILIKFGPSNTAYALTSTQGLSKSLDFGVTWTSITSSLTTDTIDSSFEGASSVTNFYDLALDSKQAGVVYLGTEQGLYRSVNDGANWSFLSLPLKNSALRVSAVAVSPDNSNVLFVTVASTVYKSVNGGLTWETKVLPTQTPIYTIAINPLSANIIYLGLRNP